MNNIVNLYEKRFEKRAGKNVQRATEEQKQETLEIIGVILETMQFARGHYGVGEGQLITAEIAVHIKNFYRELSKLTARLEIAEGNHYAEHKYQLQGMLMEEILSMDEFTMDGEDTIQ